MKTEARINKLEKRAEAIYERKIIVCLVSGSGESEMITYEGKEYTRPEWDAWTAENMGEDDTVISVGYVEKREY